MNPDPAMGEDLLKKTGAGTCSWCSASPTSASPAPTTATSPSKCAASTSTTPPPASCARPPSTTSDAGSSTPRTRLRASAREAYFLGAGDPYEKLRRALRADIDEAAWDALYQSTSRPFPVPETGKIAMKVINHYGDEVMKVCDVAAQ